MSAIADDMSMTGKPLPADILEALRAQVSRQQLVEAEIPIITSVTATLMEDMVENAMAVSQHENAVHNKNKNNNSNSTMLEIGDSTSVDDYSDSEYMPKKDPKAKKKKKKKQSLFALDDNDDDDNNKNTSDDPKENMAEPTFHNHPAMTSKERQAQSQAELNEIFVLYGVDPASIKPTEIPRPLPDWSINDSRWKTDIVQRKEEEEEQQQKILLELASSRTNLDMLGSSKKSKKKKKKKSKQREPSSLPFSDAENSVGWSEGTSSSEDSEGLPKARRPPFRRATTDEAIARSMKVDDFDALPPLKPMDNNNSSSARRRSNRLSPPPPRRSIKDRRRSRNDNDNSDNDDDPIKAFLALSVSAGPVDERELMTAAQRTMACLDDDALSDLQSIVVENGTPADTVDELVAQSPSGSFLVVASQQGEFYSLEPKTLADFVRSRL